MGLISKIFRGSLCATPVNFENLVCFLRQNRTKWVPEVFSEKIPKYGYLFFGKITPEHGYGAGSWAAGDTSPTNPNLSTPPRAQVDNLILQLSGRQPKIYHWSLFSMLVRSNLREEKKITLVYTSPVDFFFFFIFRKERWRTPPKKNLMVCP